MSKRLVIGSRNAKKVKEMKALIVPDWAPPTWADSWEIVGLDLFPNAPEPEETGETFAENARIKASEFAKALGEWVLADDSGLEVDGLDGRPGVRSHRYGIPRAGETQDQANNKKLLEELKNLPAEKRTARFVCHLAMVMEGVLIHTVGALEGTIAMEPRGNQGFGYDPLFIPHGQTQTLGELGSDYKMKFSHRALAVEAFVDEIKKQEIVLAKP